MDSDKSNHKSILKSPEIKRTEPADPFGDFFSANSNFTSDLSIFNERQVQKLSQIRKTYLDGTYTFHQALDHKSGPRTDIYGISYKMLSSYDYLGLIGHPDVEEAAVDAIREFGTGSGGVRLLTGTNKLHLKLEKIFTDFKGTEAAAAFTSGYNASLAIISLLMESKDIVLVDNKIHQSTIDACKLAGVPFRRFEHNDASSLEKLLQKYCSSKKVMIVSEGIFSMDGDICDLPKLVELKKKYKAFLMIDEAHSLGVLGRNGKGVDDHFSVSPADIDVFVGSFSKGIPANGGFVAGSKALIILLQHASTPYIFSAAQSPATVASIIAAIKVMESEPERFERLWNNYHFFKSGLNELGYDTGNSASPILPIILGSDEAALKFSRKLFDEGILATAVIFPAVPKNQARLRLCITAAQDRDFLQQCLDVFGQLKP